MDPLCRATAPGARFPLRRLALTVAAGLLFGSSSYAATFGHSRIASAAGEPLVIMVPVSGLSAQDIQSLSAQVAPAADWAQAGLVPPVALSDLRVSVEAGVQPATRVLRVQSSQALEGTLADLLLDVHTASGQQRYQVTLLARGPAQSARPVTSTTTPKPTATSADAVGQSAHSSTRRVPEGTVAVHKGDNMFSIARRHAVDGVTVYQMMMALQRTNPEAFIEKNINLVKAGERLAMPGMDELLALSDRDARREFQAQAAAFAEYRARHGGKQGAALTQAGQGTATQGGISKAEGTVAAPVAQGDHLSLSGGVAAAGKGGDVAQAQADTRTAQGKAVADAQGRVSQLEENVGHLSEALKAQGEAARSAVLGGAKDLSNSLSDVADAVSQASREAVAQASGAAAADPAGSAAASASSAGQPAGASGGASAATGSTAASGSSTAPGMSSASSSSSNGSPVVAAQGGVSAAGATQGSVDPLSQPISPKAEKTVSWLQEHLLGVMTGLLALIVLVIAWLLRRANGARDDVLAGAQITEAMVKEKLQNIDLDLTPEADGSKRRDG